MCGNPYEYPEERAPPDNLTTVFFCVLLVTVLFLLVLYIPGIVEFQSSKFCSSIAFYCSRWNAEMAIRYFERTTQKKQNGAKKKNKMTFFNNLARRFQKTRDFSIASPVLRCL